MVEGNSTSCIRFSHSLLLNRLEPISSKAKLLLPIMQIGIVAYAFTLSWDSLCRNSCIARRWLIHLSLPYPQASLVKWVPNSQILHQTCHSLWRCCHWTRRQSSLGRRYFFLLLGEPLESFCFCFTLPSSYLKDDLYFQSDNNTLFFCKRHQTTGAGRQIFVH